jgi:putative transposase
MFIDENRAWFGVESICKVLTGHGCKIAPSGYYAAKKRPPSKRCVPDEVVLEHTVRVHTSRRQGRWNYGLRRFGLSSPKNRTVASTPSLVVFLVVKWNG